MKRKKMFQLKKGKLKRKKMFQLKKINENAYDFSYYFHLIFHEFDFLYDFYAYHVVTFSMIFNEIFLIKASLAHQKRRFILKASPYAKSVSSTIS